MSENYAVAFYPLFYVPSACETLETVAAELRQKGESYATLKLFGESQVYSFDVLKGIHFHDHGAGVKGLRCQACPNGHTLRYEFRITTVDGLEIGPIGSNCVFTRALGRERAQTLGKRLEGGLEGYQKQQLAEAQRALLEQAGNWRAYIRGLGFEWVLLALAGQGHLPLELRASLQKAQDRNLPLTAPQIGELSAMNRAATPLLSAATFSLSVPLSTAAPAFTPSAAPSEALARPQKTLRPRLATGSRMKPADWDHYVIHNRLTMALKHWPLVAEQLPFDEETKTEIKQTLDGHCALRPEHHTAVIAIIKTLKFPQTSPAPDPLRRKKKSALQQPQWRDSLERELEARAAEEQHARAVQNMRQLAQQSGLDVLDTRNDPLVRQAHRHWINIRYFLPATRRDVIEEGLSIDCLREDDYNCVVQAMHWTHNPQDDASLRNQNGFLNFLEFLVRRAKQPGLVLKLRNPEQQATLLEALKPELHYYISGLQINEETLLRSFRAFVQISEPPQQSVSQVPISRKSHFIPQAKRDEAISLWGQGLAERLPQAHRRSIGQALRKAHGLTQEQHQLFQVALTGQRQIMAGKSVEPVRQPASIEATSTLPNKERAEMLRLWRRGLADQIPPLYRETIRKSLHGGRGPSEQHLKLLRTALLDMKQTEEQKRKLQPKAQLGPSPTRASPIQEAHVANMSRTATSFTAAIASLLNTLGRDDLRRRLALQRTTWAASILPEAFRLFQDTGEVITALVPALEARL